MKVKQKGKRKKDKRNRGWRHGFIIVSFYHHHNMYIFVLCLLLLKIQSIHSTTFLFDSEACDDTSIALENNFYYTLPLDPWQHDNVQTLDKSPDVPRRLLPIGVYKYRHEFGPVTEERWKEIEEEWRQSKEHDRQHRIDQFINMSPMTRTFGGFIGLLCLFIRC